MGKQAATLNTRDQITALADKLFYEQGFEHTSFADIAEKMGISRGNFYHHFKTKDEILTAVIGLRRANTERMLEKWQAEGKNPKERIASFIQILIMNLGKIRSFGCPVGSLCAELVKLDHTALKDAAGIFELFREWLKKQFLELGHKSSADRLAMHVLAISQGVAVLAATYQDDDFVRHEVKSALKWLETV